ncbi:MAG: hypothetical protein ABSA08_07785 [Acidimicrobiales bacterium]
MTEPHQVTWIEVGLSNAGLRTTMRAFKFAVGWGVTTAALGRPPESVEEYADATRTSRATAFRDQQAFRAAFPLEDGPERMNAVTGAQAAYEEIFRRVDNAERTMLEAQPVMVRMIVSPAVS